MRPALVLLLAAAPAFGQYLQPTGPAIDPLREVRQCGAPPRDAAGKIKRRSDVVAAFRRLHPCPVTGRATGACPNFSIDHIIPLAKGGCDSVSNMAWMPNAIKSCASDWCKDRWERIYYGSPHGIVRIDE